jgi:hypothetical protein
MIDDSFAKDILLAGIIPCWALGIQGLSAGTGLIYVLDKQI